MSKISAMKKTVPLLLVLAAGVFPMPAFAEMEVIASTAANLSVGAKLPDDAKFDIDEGEVVRVMNKGKTFEITGPYSGTLDQYRSACPWWQDVLGKCVKRPADDGSTPGATRSIAPTDDVTRKSN
jgi:hypothetical protein